MSQENVEIVRRLLRRLGAGRRSAGPVELMRPGDRVRRSRRGRGAGNPTRPCRVQQSGREGLRGVGDLADRSRSEFTTLGDQVAVVLRVPGTRARERRRGGGPRVVRCGRFRDGKVVRDTPGSTNRQTPSKPPGCRSRRCRRRTWRSFKRGARRVQPPATSKRCWRKLDPDVEWHPALAVLLGGERTVVSRARRASASGSESWTRPSADVPGRDLGDPGPGRQGRRDRTHPRAWQGERSRDRVGLLRSTESTLRRTGKGDSAPDLPRPERSPRSRRALGVGDVAGERGDRAQAASRRGTRETWTRCFVPTRRGRRDYTCRGRFLEAESLRGREEFQAVLARLRRELRVVATHEADRSSSRAAIRSWSSCGRRAGQASGIAALELKSHRRHRSSDGKIIRWHEYSETPPEALEAAGLRE